MIYTLMNKHIPLADINFSSLGHIDEICKVYTPEAFPVGIITKDNSPTSKITRDYLYNWWKNRIIPASRDGLNTLLHIYRIENTSSLAIKSLGLSLSDQYWIKPKGSDISWNDVNFFTNDFSSDLGTLFFSKNQSSRQNINPFSPDASSNGWLKKKWIIINDKRYLAKAGSGTLHQEPYNEVAISKILDLLKIKHIEYKTIMENNRPLCLCENFINPNTEFVPANLIYNVLPQKNNESNLTHFFKCAEYLQIPGIKDYINNFLTIDYLTENTDRHYGNFGFIRNINTLKFISPAPIFDNGTSLWNNCLDSEIGEWQSCMPFKKNHREQIKLVTSFNISEQSLKKCERIIKNELSKSPLLSPHRIDKISKYVGNRARLLENIISKVNTLSR